MLQFFTRILSQLAPGGAILAAIIAMIAVSTPTEAVEPRTGRYSKLPLPRYASLKADLVYMRRGPGQDYAIKWELRRRNLPIRVISEHGVWRRVELFDGDRGWIHRALLSGERFVVAQGAAAELYDAPSGSADLAARIPTAAPMRLLTCTLDWCQAETERVRGWAPKRRLWGVDADDVFD